MEFHMLATPTSSGPWSVLGTSPEPLVHTRSPLTSRSVVSSLNNWPIPGRPLRPWPRSVRSKGKAPKNRTDLATYDDVMPELPGMRFPQNDLPFSYGTYLFFTNCT
jgi:hypothetical protein